MITSHYFIPNLIINDFAHELFRHNKVIKTPANIFRASVHHVRPECVCFCTVWVEFAERIDKTLLEQSCQPITFLLGESSITFVGFGIGQIDLLMSHVQIACQDDMLFLFQVAKIHSGK